MTNNEELEKNSNLGNKETFDFDDERHARIQATLGYSSNYINTDKFEDAELRCRFGGIEVHFDKAKLHNGRGTIVVDLAFGGIELYVPTEWNIRKNVRVALGVVEEKGANEGTSDNYLNIMGNVRFGAVEIIYV